MQKKLALIVATYNRAKRIPALLESIHSQTLPHELWEAILCVDGSTDNTTSILEEWSQKQLFPLRYLFQQNTGQAGARHRAILHTEANYIVIIDDDMELAPDFLMAHYQALENDPHFTVVIGKVVPLPEWYKRPLFEAVREDFMKRLHEFLENNPDFSPTATAFVTQNVSFSRQLYLEVGGFDCELRLGEDTELGIKLERARAKFIFSKEAWARHASDIGNYENWAKRQYRYGFFACQIWEKHNRDPLLHPLRNLVTGNRLNNFLVHLSGFWQPSVKLLEWSLRFLGFLLRIFRLWRLAIQTHKPIQSLLYHAGVRDSFGSWKTFLAEERRFKNSPECPKEPLFKGNTKLS